MKKSMSEDEFQKTILKLDIGKQNRDIAYGVLVLGHQQKYYVDEFNISKGAVSQAVNRVWNCYRECSLPQGYAKVTAILTEQQAYQVKLWERNAKKKMESN